MIPKKNWENFTEPDIVVSTATKSDAMVSSPNDNNSPKGYLQIN
jgi:hypothetical protein